MARLVCFWGKHSYSFKVSKDKIQITVGSDILSTVVSKWYQKIFKLQFSAKNHPDSSAAMRLSEQIMYFYSFGYYHHDLAFAVKKGVQ